MRGRPEPGFAPALRPVRPRVDIAISTGVCISGAACIDRTRNTKPIDQSVTARAKSTTRVARPKSSSALPLTSMPERKPTTKRTRR